MVCPDPSPTCTPADSPVPAAAVGAASQCTSVIDNTADLTAAGINWTFTVASINDAVFFFFRAPNNVGCPIRLANFTALLACQPATAQVNLMASIHPTTGTGTSAVIVGNAASGWVARAEARFTVPVGSVNAQYR